MGEPTRPRSADDGAPTALRATAGTGPDAAPPLPPVGSPGGPLAVLFAQASFWRGQHQVAQALDSLRRALELAPNDADALFMMARLEIAAGAAAEAEAATARLRAAHPGDPRIATLEAERRAAPPEAAALAQARASAQAGKLADAVGRYRQAFGGGPPPAELATEYFETLGGTSGGFDAARDGLRRAIEADPRDLAAQLAYARLLTYREISREEGIGRLAALSKDPAAADQAGKSLRQALLWLPDDPSSLPLLEGFVSSHPGEEELRRKLEAARHPPQMPAFEAGHARIAGYAELKGHLLAQAERDFRKALATNGDDADATAGMGLVRLQQGRVPEGRALLRQALKLGPSETAGILAALRGTEGRGAGDPASAARAGFAAVARLARAGRFDEAEAQLKRLAGPRPSGAVEAELGGLQARAGRLGAAEASFRRALAAGPSSSAALIGLAGVLLRLDRAGEAEALYARVGDAAGRRAVGRARAENLRQQARAVADPVARVGLYRSAVAADPANPWLRLEMARALAAQNRGDDARSVMSGVGEGSDPEGLEAAFYFAADGGDLATAAALAARLPAARRTPQMAAVQDRAAARVEIARVGLRPEDRTALIGLAARPDASGARVFEIAAALTAADDRAGARDAVATAIGAGRPLTADQRLSYAGALLAAGYGDEGAAIVEGLDGAALPRDERDGLESLRDGVAAAQADALGRQGRDDEAYRRLAPRLALHPDRPSLNVALAGLYRRRGDAARAVAITGALLDREPGDLDLRRAAVEALIDAGDLDTAAATAAEGVRGAPRDPRAFLISAAVAKARDDGGRALADLRSARALRVAAAASTVGVTAAGREGTAGAATAAPVPRRGDPSRGESPTGDALPLTPGVLGEAASALPSDALGRSIDRDIADLRDRVAPAVQTGLALLARSGEAGLGRLTVVSAPVEASTAPGGIGRLRIQATPTLAEGGTAQDAATGSLPRFGTEPLRAAAGLVPAGLQRSVGTALDVSYAYRFATADIGTTPLGFQETSVIGGLELAPQIGPDLRLRLTGERRAIVNSVLSYAGARDPVTGLAWGGVVGNRGIAQVEWAPGRWFVYGGAGGGVVTGHHVLSNPFLQAQLGGSYRVLGDGARELRVGVSLPYFDYRRNENSFTYGHGGYFSPQHYVAAQVPVTWRDRPTERLSYAVEASIGLQSFAQGAAAVFPGDPVLEAQLVQAAGSASAATTSGSRRDIGPAGGISGEVEYRLNDALRFEARAAVQRAGDYTEGSAQVSARYSFDQDR